MFLPAEPKKGICRRGLISLAGKGALALTTAAWMGLSPATGWTNDQQIPDPSRTGSPLDNLIPVIDPVLRMRNTNTGEEFSGTYFSWESGRYHGPTISELNWFFRDWRRSETHMIDPRLLWALSAISQGSQADGHSGDILMNSGFRTKQTNDSLEGAAQNSLHLTGRAVDFAMEGISTTAIRDYMLWLQVGGVGHYPGRFVHIDSGRIRSW